MSYLKFDKTVMINLEESLTREVLRTNRLGAYHCTTVVDCNTGNTTDYSLCLCLRLMMTTMCYCLLLMRR